MKIRWPFGGKREKPRIAVDLDGVLAQAGPWMGVAHYGPMLDGAAGFMEELGGFAYVIVHSCRGNPEVGEGQGPEHLSKLMEGWLTENGIHFDEVWVGPGKPVAEAYIDDRAVACVPDPDNPRVAYTDAVNRTKLLCHVDWEEG